MSDTNKDKEFREVNIDELCAILDALAHQTPKDMFTALMAMTAVKFCDKHNFKYADWAADFCKAMYLVKSEDDEEATLHMLIDMHGAIKKDMLKRKESEDDSDDTDYGENLYGNYDE